MPRPPSKTRVHQQIYSYLDFRHFLRDLIAELKQRKKGFTVRAFSQSAGFGSPSYLKMIIDGERRLTGDSVEKFCQALDITGREKDYFTALVAYNQCREPDAKTTLFAKVNRIRPRKTLSPVEKSQLKFFTRDHYASIREMVLLDDFKEDAKWIAARCVPRISPAEVREALDTLQNLKMLSRDAQGRLIQSESIVGTQAETDIIEAFNFHDTVLTKARNALSRVPQDKRHFEALTIPVNPALAKSINQKIMRLIDEVLDEVNVSGQKFTEVYQLSAQFFPATTREHVTMKNSRSESNSEQGPQHESKDSGPRAGHPADGDD